MINIKLGTKNFFLIYFHLRKTHIKKLFTSWLFLLSFAEFQLNLTANSTKKIPFALFIINQRMIESRPWMLHLSGKLN